MKTKEILQMIISLYEGRIQDAEVREIVARFLIVKIDLLTAAIRNVAALAKVTNRDEDVGKAFDEILTILSEDTTSADGKLILDRAVDRGDQIAAEIERIKGMIDQLPDEE